MVDWKSQVAEPLVMRRQEGRIQGAILLTLDLH